MKRPLFIAAFFIGRASENHVPPYPAWVARLNPMTTQVVMACFGVQCRDGRDKALAALQSILVNWIYATSPVTTTSPTT